MKNGKGGCLCRCIHNSLNFTTQNELDKNAKDIESLLVEIEPLSVKFKKLDHINHLQTSSGRNKPLDNLYSQN